MASSRPSRAARCAACLVALLAACGTNGAHPSDAAAVLAADDASASTTDALPDPDAPAPPDALPPDAARPLPDADALPPVPARLSDAPRAAFAHAPGSGLAAGLVTGRIYDDLAGNPDARMRDLAALGVRIIRIEIERTTPWSQYQTLVSAAQAYGIEVLALVSWSALPDGTPHPMDGTLADFDARFVPAYLDALDETQRQLPSVRYVEVWNEPGVYEFTPTYYWVPGHCEAREGATRYALLVVRAFEHTVLRRERGERTALLAGFDFSRQDDGCGRQVVFDAAPITNHRRGFRAPRGMPDALPVDIVSIHGYGNAARLPGEAGYTYAGGTFRDGVSEWLGARFSDNGASVIGPLPVWYTELGYGVQTGGIGGSDPVARQRLGLEQAFTELRSRANVTAVFWYDYRDDEPGAGTEGNQCGLRGSSAAGYAPRPAYTAFQAQSAAGGDRVAPAGALLAPAMDARAAPGAAVMVRGWAIDNDGAAPTVEIAVDGAVQTSVVDGATRVDEGCATVSSARCPAVGFAATVTLPAARGWHEVAARARDRAGNARVIGRADVAVE